MLKNIVKSCLALAGATGLATVINLFGVGNESIIMVFLLGVLITAVLTSSRAWSIGSALLSVMLFNFLFTEPRFTFLIYSSNDLMLLAFFLVTAIISGSVTSRLQTERVLTSLNEQMARTFYNIATAFLSASGQADIVALAGSLVKEYTGITAQIRLENIPFPSAQGEEPCFDIESPSGKLGQISLHAETLSSDHQRIIQAICTQLGIALERERLVEEREEIKIAIERERQRTTLLRSIAHDLRTPLTALNGAGGLLADSYNELTDTERRKLASDVSEEIVWLSDLVENILNMTRISEGQLLLQKEEEVIDDVIAEAVKHTERVLRGHHIQVVLPEDVVTARMDSRLIVQVIVNLLENAARHTAQESTISLTVTLQNTMLLVSVADTGNGVPEEIRSRLFERFVTQDGSIVDGKRGLGLGLAICKTIVEAHGGQIWHEENHPNGSVFCFTLPMEEAL